jgi:hypothetical protein
MLLPPCYHLAFAPPTAVTPRFYPKHEQRFLLANTAGNASRFTQNQSEFASIVESDVSTVLTHVYNKVEHRREWKQDHKGALATLRSQFQTGDVKMVEPGCSSYVDRRCGMCIWTTNLHSFGTSADARTRFICDTYGLQPADIEDSAIKPMRCTLVVDAIRKKLGRKPIQAPIWKPCDFTSSILQQDVVPYGASSSAAANPVFTQNEDI